MPKSSLKVFKKRKRVFPGQHVHSKSNSVIVNEENENTITNLGLDDGRPMPGPSTSNNNAVFVDTESRASTSSKKISSNLDAYRIYEGEETLNDCYDLINLQKLENLLSKIGVCSKCHNSLSVYATNRLGLSVSVNIKCQVCDFHVSEKNSPVVSKKNAVNVRLAYAFRCIGKGETAARNFCGIMNLPNPPEFRLYNEILLQATKEVCSQSMRKAVEECVAETDSRDITAIFDGSWQRRGHNSQNGIVSAISATNGKVIDVRILSKYCRCEGKLNKEHEPTCTANYSGVSGGMESKGILDMFQQSEATYGIRYKNFLGDGDSSAYPTVVAAQPYGPDFSIDKLECVGHIQKRMGSRLRTLKTAMKNTKLEDGKTFGGRGRITWAAINEIQNYYGLAIRRNVNSLESMKASVWATYFHLSSTNQSSAHELCTKGADSWCKFQKAKANGEKYDHSQHTHYPKVVMDKIKPIFRDLAKPELLSRCLHGGTQNASESLNSVVWSRLPKSNFVQRKTLEIGVFEAIATYNEGNIARCQILQNIGIPPGSYCIKRMKTVDSLRIRKADKAIEEIEKKCRQRRALLKRKQEDQEEAEEDPDRPSYGSGMY